MIVSRQTRTREKVIGQYYVTVNEWTTDVGAGAIGMNLKGIVVCMDLRTPEPEQAGADLGTGANIGSPFSAGCPYSPVGVLMDDLILGQQPIRNLWVNVLMHGHTDRILAVGGAVATNDVALFTGLDSGLVRGMSQAEISAGIAAGYDNTTPIIGWHYSGDAEAVPEEVAAGKVLAGDNTYRQVKGYVKCLGVGNIG